MTDPTIPATLTQAAERADKVLPPTIAELVYNELKGAGRGPDCYPDSELPFAHAIAREVLAMAAPVPAVDRDSLADMLMDVLDEHTQTLVSMVDDGVEFDTNYGAQLLADALLARGLVTTGQAPDGLLDHATTFRFLLYPEGHEFWDIADQDVTIEWRGADSWAVLVRGSCVDAEGKREYEPNPSSRDDDFKTRFRFTRDEAIRIAREVAVPAERARWDARLARKAGLPVEEGGQGG